MKRISAIMLAVMVLTSGIGLGNVKVVYANDFIEEDYRYTVIEGMAEIQEYLGNDTVIAIPSELGGYPVTGISDFVFFDRGIKEVTIPASVKSIGAHAFRENQIENIILHEGLEYIGGMAFLSNAIKEIEIPTSVITLEYGVFSNNEIENVILHEGLEIIGDTALSGNKISDLTLPNTLTYIGEYAFNNNVIEYLVIPGSVQTISGWAFFGNEIRSLVLQEGVEKIGERAFKWNPLREIVFPETLREIGTRAFAGSRDLYLEFPASLEVIGSGAFEFNSELDHVVVNNPNVVFGETAFYKYHQEELNPGELTVYGYKGSTAEDLANSYPEFTFYPIDEAPVLENIEITKLPDRMEYFLDESLNMEGSSVVLSYSDGKKTEVEGNYFRVTGFDSGAISDKQELTIEYKGKTTAFHISVQEKPEFEGEGTEESPYLLSTPEEFLEFRDAINHKELNTEFAFKHYRLTTDLDLSQLDNWVPVGSGNGLLFSGSFDGNGHRITGLSIDKTVAGDTENYNFGFFGNIGSTGTIKDLQFTNADIRLQIDEEAIVSDIILGGIVGNNEGELSNVSFDGKIEVLNLNSSGMVIGGIAGKSSGFISDVKSSGKVNLISHVEQGTRSIGGIAGMNTGTIQNAENRMNLKGEGYNISTGGIAGASYSNIMNVVNFGEIRGSNSSPYHRYSGGVIGKQYSGDGIAKIENAINAGKVISNSVAGGVIGGAQQSYTFGKIELNNLTNTGEVKGDITGGGIIGTMGEQVSLTNAYNRGAVYGGPFSGGIAGTSHRDNMQNVFNLGTITGTQDIGGIIGQLSRSNNTMYNVYNYGILKSVNENPERTLRIGGIIGDTYSYNPSLNGSVYYWDQVEHAVGSGFGSNAQRKTAEEMTSKETYSGFDFDTIWMMTDQFAHPPVLQSLYTPLESMNLYQGVIVTGMEMNILKPDPMFATFTDGHYVSTVEEVLTIDEKGNVKAHNTGVTYIIGNPFDLNESINQRIEVEQGVEEIQLPEKLTIMVGEEEMVTPLILPENSYNKTVNWDSENSSVASVDVEGRIKGKGPGTVTIIGNAADGSGTTGRIIVEVLQPVEGIEILNPVDEIAVGEKRIIDYKILPEDASNQGIYWDSSNEDVAIISDEGELKGVSPGLARMTVMTEDGGFQDTFTVEVYQKVEGVTILNKLPGIALGKSLQIHGKVLPDDAREQGLTWTSSDQDVVAIDGQGIITAKMEGEALITVKSLEGNFLDYHLMKVGKGVEKIEIDVPETIQLNDEVIIRGIIDPEDAVNRELEWTVESITGAGVITDEGIFTAKSVGEVLIRAKATDGTEIYGEKSLEIIDQLDRIEMSSLPYKTNYLRGESLDVSGGVIKGFMASGEEFSENLKMEMISGYDPFKVGAQELTVTYEHLTDTFHITVETVTPDMQTVNASDVYIDSTLQESELTGVFLDPRNNEEIEGTLKWKDESQVVTKRTQQFEWIFTPDLEMYSTVEGSIDVVGHLPEMAKRIAGDNRYLTAYEIAKFNDPNPDTVIIVRGDSAEGIPQVVDGLTASGLAGAMNAQILMVSPNRIPNSTWEAIDSLAPKNAIIVGGEAAVGAGVQQALENYGLAVSRVSGDNRYDTGAQVGLAMGAARDNTAIIVNGHAVVDSLVAGALAHKGYPILMVNNARGRIPAETQAAMKALNIEKVWIVGGTGVVSKDIEDQLNALPGVTVDARFGGNTRVETSLSLAGHPVFNEGRQVTIVNGWSYVDAVAASTLGAPVIYYRERSGITQDIEAYLTKKEGFKVIGGEQVVTGEIYRVLETIMQVN